MLFRPLHLRPTAFHGGFDGFGTFQGAGVIGVWDGGVPAVLAAELVSVNGLEEESSDEGAFVRRCRPSSDVCAGL